jgi:peptidyl-prolyl cis-trans isomerase B (cyclophilin B)
VNGPSQLAPFSSQNCAGGGTSAAIGCRRRTLETPPSWKYVATYATPAGSCVRAIGVLQIGSVYAASTYAGVQYVAASDHRTAVQSSPRVRSCSRYGSASSLPSSNAYRTGDSLGTTSSPHAASTTSQIQRTSHCIVPSMAEPVVDVTTNHGTFTIELDPAKAPATVANFLQYVDAGHYDGTIFHRVIATFMIQGGGYDQMYEKKPVRAPIQNEADNGLKNKRGTVAMARTGDPHSATAQWFVNVVDNAFLDHKAKDAQGWGYAVFGRVIEGMDVVDKIKAVPTGANGPFAKDAPDEMVVIQRVRRR